MATSSSIPIAALVPNNKNTHNHKNFNDDSQFSFLNRSNLQRFSITTPSNKVSRDLIVRRATPEVAGELLSSFSLPGMPWFPTDNPWLAWGAGLLVGGPFLIQGLVAFITKLDMAAQVVENIADAVEKEAEKLEEALPEGRFKQVVNFVEHIAEEISDLMDKTKRKTPPSSSSIKSYERKLFTSPEERKKTPDYQEKFYKKLRDEDRELKKEIRDLFARSLVKDSETMKGLLLENKPLVKLYDMFVEEKYSTKYGGEGSSKLASLVVLSDSTVDN